ncbi:MAG: M20 family metallopeptidase [Anaerolineae bacterium]
MTNEFLSLMRELESAYLNDLAEMVNIDCGTETKPGVDAVGDMMRRHFAAIGADVQTFPQTEYGDCLLGTLRGSGAARIFMIGHLDTVYPVGTAAARPMRQEGDRLLGPGVCDMKNGLLAGVYALRLLQAVGWNDFAEIRYFCNSDEEVGSPASRAVYPAFVAGCDAALVLESGRPNGDIVTARKGSAFYTVDVTGRAAHAGVEPEKGASAILALAHLTVALHALNGVRPGVTVNVGVVNGGTKGNVVPAEARAQVDVRALTSEDLAFVDNRLRELAAMPAVPGVTIHVAGGSDNPPMPRLAASARLAEIAQEAASQTGFRVGENLSGGVSDANYCAAQGVPTLDGLGPVGGQDHSPAEYLEVESIVPRVAMLARLLQLIAEEAPTLRALRTAS